MSQAKINYPQSGTEIKMTNFAASGSATVGIALRSELIGSEGTRAKGKTARPPDTQRNWLIVFQNVEPKDGETFRLEIWEDTPNGKQLASADKLTFCGAYGVSITYPDANSVNQCKDNIMAYGTFSDPDTGVTCTIGTKREDFLYEDQATGFWSAQLSIDPAGVYTLTVTGNATPTNTDSINVNCQSTYC